jgi:hypothetical protein
MNEIHKRIASCAHDPEAALQQLEIFPYADHDVVVPCWEWGSLPPQIWSGPYAQHPLRIFFGQQHRRNICNYPGCVNPFHSTGGGEYTSPLIERCELEMIQRRVKTYYDALTMPGYDYPTLVMAFRKYRRR